MSNPSTPDPSIQLALAHHKAGRLPDAQAICRQILDRSPHHPAALNLLGGIAVQAGDFARGLEIFRSAIAASPNSAASHFNSGICLKELGKVNDAIAAFQVALSLDPRNFGAAFQLGNTLMVIGQTENAVAAYQQAIRLKPDYAQAHNNLGAALNSLGRVDEAIENYHRALGFNANYPEALNNLGQALQARRDFDAAITYFQKSLQSQPGNSCALDNLGCAQIAKGRLDAAIASFRQAISLNPALAPAHHNLGNALQNAGEIDEAIAAFRAAISVAPSFAGAHSSLIHALHFHPAANAEAIFEESRRWNEQHARPLEKFISPHSNDPAGNRPLKIGFISPDLRDHPVGRFLIPLFNAHDRENFIITCYSDATHPDRITRLLRDSADEWRDTAAATDEQLARVIRDDKIDILFDLAMHTAGNRLLVFARKPAPVQAGYLAYCSTTGLDTIDYRLTDPHLDQPEISHPFYSEKSVHLPDCYWCYSADDSLPAVGPLPASSGSPITFGCLNNFAKVSAAARRLWIQILNSVPESRLLLNAPEGSTRERLRQTFAEQGIDPSRLKFTANLSRIDYFKLFNEIDIALDPMPFTGGTTTCDGFWMGVPAVTLAGSTAVGRGGVTLLRNLGLPQLIAETEQQYIQIAVDLAADLANLAQLRKSLRSRMLASPLMDGPRFARNFESVCRKMWENRRPQI